jgi:hypothetical protein
MKSQDIVNERCFYHIRREAVAVCPECKRFFCRECITEHEDRVICASCLKKKFPAPDRRRLPFVSLMRTGQVITGILVLWILFYFLGQILVSIPSSFHEGTVWKSAWKIANEEESPKTTE